MEGPRDPAAKVLGRAELLARHGRPRGQALVFTNGCFDLFHRGHAGYLQHARTLGEALVVAINSDRSVRSLKGASRPFMTEEDRGLLLASLEFVDAVTVFDEETPESLVAALLPDVLVKGADYSLDQIAGRQAVERAGGRVMTLPLVEGRSTSALIARIQEAKGVTLPPERRGGVPAGAGAHSTVRGEGM